MFATFGDCGERSAGSRKQEAGSRKQEAGRRKKEAGRRKKEEEKQAAGPLLLKMGA